MGLFLVAAIACAGPETGDDVDSTPVAIATVTPTPSPTIGPSPTLVAVASPVEEPTATPSPSATPTATSEASPVASPVEEQPDLASSLPELTDVPGEGYIVAENGTRTAQDLANAYIDPAAHLQRLNEWGFKRHAFRAFIRDAAGDSDPHPTYILATINEYGSDEQAAAALEWLKQSGVLQGAVEVEAPQVGDSAVAITVPTAEGIPTASLYVRRGSSLYVYFAQGGDPLTAVSQVATNVLRPGA